jgi:release factor glutamine methyltransferase
LQFLKYIANKTLRPILLRYLAVPRKYTFEGVKLVVQAGIFHPGFFFSTRFLLSYLKGIDLKNKSFLELGAGSGLVSIYASKQGATATASDISPKAVENVKQNQQLNNCSFPVIHSDLFSNIPTQKFDIIAVNPPYYKKNPATEKDHAWYCGGNMEYFARLFSTIKNYIHSQSQVIMVLSDECDITEVKKIAVTNNLILTETLVKKNWSETLFIYKLKPL